MSSFPPGTLVRTPHDGVGVVVAFDDPRIRWETDRQTTMIPLVDAATQANFKGWWQESQLENIGDVNDLV